ncbi:hypothetical protein AK812_SmicGene28945 [Symbiodinium microadriaticum]|uniref:Phospholipase/carboxylesterase/thioesterase domain-containing protein n=1 Tax=Symbiodinium microadriaticum TaxID=2951 RepID=A0A1Q9D336_SYMMI|nr:hypothetical protein AK812_SmicGene28945 [Symbiodinium microadriaticum]
MATCRSYAARFLAAVVDCVIVHACTGLQESVPPYPNFPCPSPVLSIKTTPSQAGGKNSIKKLKELFAASMALAPPSLPVLCLWQPVASPCGVFTEISEIRALLAGASPWFSGLLGLIAYQRFRQRAARCRARAGHDDIPTCQAGGRRQAAASIAFGAAAPPYPATAESQSRQGQLVTVRDPETYSALAYSPRDVKGPLPLLVVLPGAGRNDKDATDLANIRGEHGGLAPSLIAEGIAPADLTENFAVLAPYAAGKKSFYEEPRKKMLQFIAWACSDAGRAAGVPAVDLKRLFLFGFSDGATEVMELASTRRFAGCVVAAYGFTGELPRLALERLKDIPVWVFHSADDVIFPVSCSDKLVKRLKETNSRDVVRYTRYNQDQEGFTGSVRGHSTGITASRQPDLYRWLLQLGPLD